MRPDDKLPTGAQLAADYLQPPADLPALKPHVRYDARVVAVTRLGLDRLLPDVVGRDRDRFAGRRILVVGAGHSAPTLCCI